MPEIKRYKQYEILQHPDGTQWALGSGAMGTTYKAFDTNLQRQVALKIINDAYLGNDIARQQFLREARSAAGLRHPNIASVYDLGTDQDQYFYVMELIEGITVKDKIQRDGPLNPWEALGLMLQISSALAAAERQQLVHRDLKPANLMLTEEEDEQIVKIIDFGLAKKIHPSGEASGAFTIAGGFVGTAEFASPEQIRESDLDVRSDIYSLGATLFFILIGRPPFTGAAGEVMSYHLYKAIPTEALSNQPESVVELVQRMMEKEREKRPQTAAELRHLIEGTLRDLSAPAGAERFKLKEPQEETPQGQWFHALDERTDEPVEVFIFNRDILSSPGFLAALRTQIELVRNTPHPLLRTVYALEETADRTFLVEEAEFGLSLQDLLRTRQQLTPPEVAILLTRLAPLADHAQRQGLRLVDLTLPGIRLRSSARSADHDPTPLAERRLDSWKPLELKVDPIDLSLVESSSGTSVGAATWQGEVTLLNAPGAAGPRSSYLRLLSLLGYELLGGQRNQVETSGRMSPLAEINEEANVILRRGAVDEFGSATEMANAFKRALASAAGVSSKTQDVFISYSSNDKAVADAACAILEQQSIRCWVAPRDIAPGADWGDSIVEAITGSTVMLLIFSSHANRSQQIKREVECAFGADVTVVPFRIEKVDPTGAFRFFLGNIHWLDALSTPLEVHLLQAADHINAILGRSASASPEPLQRSSGSSAFPPVDRPPAAEQSTVIPPVLPPPLPATAFSAPSSASNLKRGSVPFGDVKRPKDRTAKSVWQNPIIWVGAATFLILCLGAVACYFTIQQFFKAAAEKIQQEQVVKKESNEKPVEEEKNPSSLARTLAVPEQYAAIQSAIDAAKAGDTVLVRAGVYNEKLKFKEGINLKGENAETTIVRYSASPTGVAGQSSYDAPLEVRNCKSGQVEQLSFEQTGADARPAAGNLFKIDAIIIMNSSIIIKNCRATSSADCGIDVDGSESAPTLIENQLRSNASSGIAFSNGAQGSAQNNVCEQNQLDGILVIGGGSAPTLTNNECRLNKRHGIGFQTDAHGNAEGNVCEQNDDSGIGVFFSGAAPALINNTCKSNKHFGIYFGKGALGKAEGNTCEQNDESGIGVSELGTEPELINNQCRFNKVHGIYLFGGVRSKVEENVCEQNEDTGIAVFDNGSEPQLINNQCRSNKHNGIYFGRGARGRAEQNACEQNEQFGIAVYEPGTDPELLKNVCRSNKIHGIHFTNGAHGRATENVCQSNGDSGIAIKSAAPFLSANVLQQNAHYGLAYNTESKPTFGTKNQISGNGMGQVINNAVFK